jgi:hypothetical protein
MFTARLPFSMVGACCRACPAGSMTIDGRAVCGCGGFVAALLCPSFPAELVVASWVEAEPQELSRNVNGPGRSWRSGEASMTSPTQALGPVVRWSWITADGAHGVMVMSSDSRTGLGRSRRLLRDVA